MLAQDKISDKLEKKFTKELLADYKVARDNIKNEIRTVFEKYSIDGELPREEMVKYNRLQNLERQIDAEIASLSRGTIQKHKGYLTDQYLENYYTTSWVLESKTAKDISFSMLNREAIYKSVMNPLDRGALADIPRQLKRDIQSSLTSGMIQGHGIRKMQKNINNAMEKGLNNAYKIARTETTRTINKAREDSMKFATTKGFEIRKQWIASNDDRTRSSHAHLNNDIVKLDKTFANGLLRPGDYTGSAAQVVNCRCTLAEVVVEVNEKRKDVKTYGVYEEWKRNRL